MPKRARKFDIRLSATEVAARLRVSTSRLSRLALAGAIPCHVARDGSVSFVRNELVRWIAGYRRPEASR